MQLSECLAINGEAILDTGCNELAVDSAYRTLLVADPSIEELQSIRNDNNWPTSFRNAAAILLDEVDSGILNLPMTHNVVGHSLAELRARRAVQKLMQMLYPSDNDDACLPQEQQQPNPLPEVSVLPVREAAGNGPGTVTSSNVTVLFAG